MAFYLTTQRLFITELTADMAEIVHLNSLDEDNRRFVPDEVFETVDKARDVIAWLISSYSCSDAPLVYPIILIDGQNIGYVQAVPFENGWEIGYHVAKQHTGNGYATEAVSAFLPVIMRRLGISQIHGICLAENIASRRVLEKCGFVLEFEGVGKYQGEDRRVCRYNRILHEREERS